MTFNEYQEAIKVSEFISDNEIEDTIEETLTIGQLKDSLSAKLYDIANLANKFNINLEELAQISIYNLYNK